MTLSAVLVGFPDFADEGAVRSAIRATRLFREPLQDLQCDRPAPDTTVIVARGDGREGSSTECARSGDWTVVLSGQLYYRSDLCRALGIELPATQPSVDLVLAALGAGMDPFELSGKLEGEYALTAWNRQTRQLLVMRDHTGMWPIYYAEAPNAVAVSSSSRLLSRLPGVRQGLNLRFIADEAAQLECTAATETAFTGVQRVPAGHLFAWTPEKGVRLQRSRPSPFFGADSGVPHDEAAEQLREILAQAVLERTRVGETGVTMSGGYDSTAVFGAGSYALNRAGEAPLRVVSVSHPPGDPGREDEWVQATAARWGVTPYWLPTGDIDVADDVAERAQIRDEPLAHLYERWNERLALECRDTASMKVILGGIGGDCWFSGSPIFFADLLREGKLFQLRREWREHLSGNGTFYNFFKGAIQPNIPESVHSLIAILRRGKRLKPLTYRPIPEWVSADWVARNQVVDRQLELQPKRRPGESHFSAERRWFLEHEGNLRLVGMAQQVYERVGLSFRMPLLDWRIVEFSASRPRWESVSGASNKHLLRRAMRGLVPDEVLAPRPRRTGLTTSYFERAAGHLTTVAQDIMSSGTLLAEYGVADGRALSRMINAVAAAKAPDLRGMQAVAQLVHTELWLRGLR